MIMFYIRFYFICYEVGGVIDTLLPTIGPMTSGDYVKIGGRGEERGILGNWGRGIFGKGRGGAIKSGGGGANGTPRYPGTNLLS